MSPGSAVADLVRKYFSPTFPAMAAEAYAFFYDLLNNKISTEELLQISSEIAAYIAKAGGTANADASEVEGWVKAVGEILVRHNLPDVAPGKFLAATLIIAKFFAK